MLTQWSATSAFWGSCHASTHFISISTSLRSASHKSYIMEQCALIIWNCRIHRPLQFVALLCHSSERILVQGYHSIRNTSLRLFSCLSLSSGLENNLDPSGTVLFILECFAQFKELVHLLDRDLDCLVAQAGWYIIGTREIEHGDSERVAWNDRAIVTSNVLRPSVVVT